MKALAYILLLVLCITLLDTFVAEQLHEKPQLALEIPPLECPIANGC